MDFVEKGRLVVQLEIDELQRLRDRLDNSFASAVGLLRAALDSGKKVVVCGVGKSGNVGRKICATLNSTGATSVVLNSQDALHGDLGVVSEGDAVLALSYSGETEEMINLLPHLKGLGVKIIAITGDSSSTLAAHCDLVLDANVSREACPLNLAPTSSSTVQLVLGDALAMVLLEARGFQQGDFARLHPGGSLGRSLLTRVADIMRTGTSVATVAPESTVAAALAAMTSARTGAAIVTAPDGTLAGVFTQGDFVRAFQKGADIAGRPVSTFMTANPVAISEDKLAVEVLNILQTHRIDDLVVIDSARRPVGLVDTQDLTRLRLL